MRNRFIKSKFNNIIMIKNLILMITLLLSANMIYSYGGGGSNVIVFDITQDSRGNVLYDVFEFDLKKERTEVQIDCKKGRVIYEGFVRDFTGTCKGFDTLKVEKANEISVYISEDFYGVLTDTYGDKVEITIDGIKYETVTNKIWRYEAYTPEVKVMPNSTNNNITIGNTTTDLNQSENLINESEMNLSTEYIYLNLTTNEDLIQDNEEEEEKRSALARFFIWLWKVLTFWA